MKKIRKLGLIILCMLMLVCSVGTLTACQGEKYTISFMVDGEVYDTLETTGDEQITMPTSPTKDGYTFDGWYYDNGEWSLSFANTSLVDTPISSDISIYAKFIIVQYTITYHNVDGATHTNPTSFTIEDTIALTDAEKARYTFLGWYSDAELTAEVTTISAGTTNIDLYAKFSIAQYTITYHNVDGATHTNPTSFTIEDTITLTDAEKARYTFLGWYSDAEFTAEVTTISAGTTNIDLYAKWFIAPTVGLAYELSTDGTYYTLTGIGSATDTDIIIPSTYNDKPVKSIGDYAFGGCSSLTSVVIPNSVTSIGDRAFRYCSSLTSIVIPDSVTSIGDHTFYYCSSLTSVVIGDSVTSIGSEAFRHCSSLTSVVIGDSVTSIGYSAFSGCTSLTKVNYTGTIDEWVQIEFGGYNANPLCNANNLYINDILVTEAVLTTATKISDYAFYYCNSLTSIVIPDSVTSIGYDAFYNCSKLTSIEVAKDNPNYKSIEGNLYSKDGKTLIQYAMGKTSTTFTIPDSVTSIGSYAFYNCNSLTSITIGDSVTSIGKYAFDGCSKLESIILPFVGATKDGTTNTHFGYIFGASSYSSNDNSVPTTLKSVTITGGKSIGSYAFSGCSSLTSITIGDSVTNIGVGAFYNCSKLTSIEVAKDNPNYKSIEGNLYSKDGKTLIQYAMGKTSTTFTIPDSVTSIGSYAFSNCTSLTSVTIPASVTSIGERAFYGCSKLESITLPFVGATKDGTTNTHFGYIFGASSYGYNGNYVPTTLKSVTITGGKSIGSYAFSGCSSLTSVVIPDSVTSIGDSAFYGCTSLTSVVIGEGVTIIVKGAFSGCRSLTSVVIPDSVTSIGSYAFRECISLTSVTIGDSVSSIGNQAFYCCRSLTSIVIPDSVTSIGSYAFYDCTSLTSVVIGDSVTSIGDYAFKYCSSLTSVVIGEGVTSIGDEAFYFCSKLTSIEVAKDNPNYKSIEGNLYSKDGKTLIQYAMGKTSTTFTIPDSVTSIGSSAFYACSSLTSVVIPDSVTSIGYDAFYGCYSLTSITIPYSVTSIGYEAFSDCTSLTKVNYTGTIDEWVQIEFGYFHCSNPLYYAKNLYINDVLVTEVNITTATKISNYAFYGCNSLTSVVIGEGVTSIGDCAFYYCSSLTSIVIPDSVTSIGDYAFSYCSSLTSITIPDSVTSISDAAFYNCSSLTSVVIPSSVTSIGDYAFEGCSSLTSITIPDSVTSIGSAAFYDCTSLTSIVIPDSVTSIDDYAFYNCSKLTSIKYRGSEQQWSAISKDYAWNYNTGNYSIIYNYSGN